MTKKLIAAAGLFALLASPVLAQTMPPSAPQSSPTAGMQQYDTPGQRKISEYFERDVYLADGTEVGEVEDLLVDASNRLTSAVVEVEGRMGLGERRVALPVERLKILSDKLVLDMTVEQLQQLPTHSSDNGK